MAETRRDWCEQACRQIRFRPDRKAVRRELSGHMEDEYRALRASGLEEDEAEQRVLENLGDPAETGRLLNRVHKPLLGWLWLASKVLVILALAAAVLCAVGNDPPFYSLEEPFLNADVTEIHMADDTAYRYRYAQPEECRDGSDGYTFRVDRAAVWEYESTDYYEFTCRLTVGVVWPWENGPVLHTMYAVDSQGSRHETYIGQNRDEGKPGWMTVHRLSQSLTTCGYSITLRNFDPAAQWVELHYDRAGRDLVLHIDLTGGEDA